MAGSISEKLSSFCNSVNFSDLPKEAIEMAKLVFLDWLGLAVRGGREDIPKVMTTVFNTFGNLTESSILYNKGKSTCLNAVMINAYSINRCA
jgi:2-methylcitrate dehydratase PrpD